MKKKRKRLGKMIQKKLNRCWSKRSLMDGYKTENARLNIYFATLRIWSLSKTSLYLSLNSLAKPTPPAKQFQLYVDFAKTAQSYIKQCQLFSKKALSPDLLRLPFTPCSFSLPTHVKTSEQPMLT